MLFRTILILLSLSLAASAQTESKTVSPQTKTAPAKSAASATTGAKPQAILHTTAGNMTCELFPAQAPKTVANFIRLATGKRPWTNPSTGKTVNGKPLYDHVIFLRVIHDFIIQVRDPVVS